MSYFSKTVTVPANTAKNNPQTWHLDVQAGVIHQVRVRIPSGHAGLTGVAIFRELHQISPTTGSSWWTGDDENIEYAEHIEVAETPYRLKIKAYNEDDTYAHTFLVSVGVLPEWVLLPQVAMSEIFSSVAKLLEGFARWFGMPRGG